MTLAASDGEEEKTVVENFISSDIGFSAFRGGYSLYQNEKDMILAYGCSYSHFIYYNFLMS